MFFVVLDTLQIYNYSLIKLSLGILVIEAESSTLSGSLLGVL